MGISFPRAMPASGPSQVLFDIQRVDFSAPEAGGYLGGVQSGFPLWISTWTIGTLSRDLTDEWFAWKDSLRGSQRPFLGFDQSRPYPKIYPAGFTGLQRAIGGAFDGSATSWSQLIDSDGNAQITLNGLPAGMVLSLRDYVGFRWDAGGAPVNSFGRRTVCRVIQSGTANGTGSVTVLAEPPVPSFVQPTVQAHLDHPSCVMKIMSGDTKLGPISNRLAISTGTIVGVQDLRA